MAEGTIKQLHRFRE